MRTHEPPTWKTKEGKDVVISEMGTDHLVNTIAFLRRRVESIRFRMLQSMDRYLSNAPDGAYDCCSAEADRLTEATIDETLTYCVPAFRELVKEAKRRLVFVPAEDEL